MQNIQLNQLTVPALVCNQKGEILALNNIATAKHYFKDSKKLGDILENFVDLNIFVKSSIFPLTQTYFLKNNLAENTEITLQIIPFEKDREPYYLVFSADKKDDNEVKQTEFDKSGSFQDMESLPSDTIANKPINITSNSADQISLYEMQQEKAALSFNKNVIFFNSCLSNFQNYFKDISLTSNLITKDLKIYGNEHIFTEVFKSLQDLLQWNLNKIDVLLNENVERKQITFELQKSTINTSQEQTLSSGIEKIQKKLNQINGKIKVIFSQQKLKILIALICEEKNQPKLKILIIDNSKTDLAKITSCIRAVDQTAKLTTFSDLKAALAQINNNYDIIIIDPYFPKLKYISKLLKSFSNNLLEQIDPKLKITANLLIVSHKTFTKKANVFTTNIIDYYRKPYRQEKIQLKIEQLIKMSQRIKNLNDYLKKAKYSAYIDELTGLFNRRYFEEFSKQLLEDSIKNKQPFLLLILDIDYFKNYNDTNGHLLGDIALKNVAEIIEGSLRKNDVASRFGGEEFVVLSTNVKQNSGFFIAEKIRKNIEKYVFEKQDKLPNKNLTVSIGHAAFPKDGDSIKLILTKADANLYLAKGKGRNQVVG